MKKFPLLFPALSLCVGVLLGEVLNLFFQLLFLSVSFVFYFAILFLVRRSYPLTVLLAVFVCMGSLLVQLEMKSCKRHQISNLKEGCVSVRGIVREEPQIFKKGRRIKFRFPLEVEWHNQRETVWVSLINARGVIKRGDELLVFGSAKRNRYGCVGCFRYQLLGVGKRSYYLMGEGHLPTCWMRKARYYLNEKFQDLLPEREALFLKAMILGDRSGISREFKDRFSRLGIFHILSVSGFHMAVVGFVFYLLGRIFLFHHKVCIGFVLLGLFIYFFVAGGRAPTLRALIMGCAFFSGRFIGRRGNGLNGLSLAVIVALLLKPSDLYSLSFQLSYLVVLGLILVMTFVNSNLNPKEVGFRFKKYFFDLTKISITAFFFSYGLISYYFGGVSAATIVVNILLSPIFVLIVSLGFLLCPVACMGEWIGGFFSLLVFLPTYILLELVKIISDLPFFQARSLHFTFTQTLVYYGLLFVLFFIFASRKKIFIFWAGWQVKVRLKVKRLC